MAGKRGTLKNFKDLRAEMHSKHTPKLEETDRCKRDHNLLFFL